MVLLTGAAIIALTWYLLRRFTRQRREYLQTHDLVDSVILKQKQVAAHTKEGLKQRAANSLRRRVSIISTIIFSLVVFLLLVFLAFPYLDQLPRTLISILVGSSAVISGIAFRPIIENFIAGVVITMARPFRIGDTIRIDGYYGTVEDITTLNTVLKIWDWRRYVVPNGQMIAKEFLHYSYQDGRLWVKIHFSVAYDADLKKVRKVAKESISGSKYVIKGTEVSFWVMDLERDGYNCWLAAWAASPADGWELASELRTRVITGFQEHGIRAQSFVVHYSAQPDEAHHATETKYPPSTF